VKGGGETPTRKLVDYFCQSALVKSYSYKVRAEYKRIDKGIDALHTSTGTGVNNVLKTSDMANLPPVPKLLTPNLFFGEIG
jgi:hypothetical protein